MGKTAKKSKFWVIMGGGFGALTPPHYGRIRVNKKNLILLVESFKKITVLKIPTWGGGSPRAGSRSIPAEKAGSLPPLTSQVNLRALVAAKRSGVRRCGFHYCSLRAEDFHLSPTCFLGWRPLLLYLAYLCLICFSLTRWTLRPSCFHAQEPAFVHVLRLLPPFHPSWNHRPHQWSTHQRYRQIIL